MMKWNASLSTRRLGKPRPGKSLSQQLACLCCRMNCLDNIDGSGCFKCEQACKNSKAAGRDDYPYFDNNWNYTYPVCNCNCNVVYHRHGASKLAKQSRIEFEEMLDTKVQTNMDSFMCFKSDITKDVAH